MSPISFKIPSRASRAARAPEVARFAKIGLGDTGNGRVLARRRDGLRRRILLEVRKAHPLHGIEMVEVTPVFLEAVHLETFEKFPPLQPPESYNRTQLMSAFGGKADMVRSGSAILQLDPGAPRRGLEPNAASARRRSYVRA